MTVYVLDALRLKYLRLNVRKFLNGKNKEDSVNIVTILYTDNIIYITLNILNESINSNIF